jgi:tRNA A-37 threonylcarbamoyl transferase component Bud32
MGVEFPCDGAGGLDLLPLMSTISDRYVFERELGRGGMATVMLAHDLVQERFVAIKILRPELAGALSHQRFVREMHLTAQLQHPHIVPLYDSGIADDVPFYVMPYIEGESLRARLDRQKQLPLPDAVRIATDIASALEYAHARGLVHRDIKPENVLLTGGQALLADFGVAHAVAEAAEDRITSTGLAVGTPAYMSPEQASGDRNIDARTDIYSLGCVLFEMIAGIPPFVGPTPQAVVARRLAADAPPVRELRPTASPALEKTIARSLERVPADRFSTAQDFAAALNEALAKPTSRGRALVGKRARGTSIVALAVVTLVAAGALGARAMLRHSSVEEQVARAKQALETLQLSDAHRQVAGALARDPTNPAANLWLAQTGAIIGTDSIPEWPQAARLAAVKPAAFDSIDRLRARALLVMSEDHSAQGCDSARPVVDAAPGDVPALLMLADCMARDDVVVRDPRTASGWRFRSSAQAAVRLYQRLIHEYPSIAPARGLVFSRLSKLLITAPNLYQPGRPVPSTDTLFGALSSIAGDTLVFIPYPLSDLNVGGRSAAAATEFASVVRQRELLRSTAADWARDFPDDPMAHLQLAKALESTGEIAASPTAPSALAEAGRARVLFGSNAPTAVRLDLSSLAVRLLIKNGQFGAASALIDSTLARNVPHSVEVGDSLTGMAVIAGRLHDALALSAVDTSGEDISIAEGRAYHVPPALSAASDTLNVRAAVGGRADSIEAYQRLVDRLLALYTSDADRAEIRNVLIGRWMSLAAPIVGATAVSGLDSTGNHLIRLEQLLAAGDRSQLRTEFKALAKLRRNAWPGATSLDATYVESWVRSAAGDTAGAINQLDQTLDALPATDNQLLSDTPLAGSLPRMMVLRVDLDAHGSDPRRQHWAGAVCDLWSHADEVLQTDRRRMCLVAGQR